MIDRLQITLGFKRLDKAIGLAWSNDMFIDEVNVGENDRL